MPVTQPITNESLTNHAQVGFVRACASRNWPICWGGGVEITDESRMNHVSLTMTDESLTYRARWRIRANTVQYSMNIRCTPNHWRIAPNYARFANVPCTSTFVPRWTWYIRGSCVIWRWGVSGWTWTCAVSNQFNFFKPFKNLKSCTNSLRHTSTNNHWWSTFNPPTNYAYDARSAQKWKSVRNSSFFAVWLAL